MQPTYEHHLDIRRRERAPFKHAEGKHVITDIFNWHKNIEILYITGGEGTVRNGTEDMAVHEGDLFIVNSNDFHQVKSKTGIDFSYLIIDESFCLENGIATAELLFERHLCEEKAVALYLAAGDAVDAVASSSSPTALPNARLAVLAFLIHLCEHHAVPRPQEKKEASHAEEYVKTTITYLADHFAEPQSLEMLAALSGISKHHLSRLFKQYTGESVFSHLTRLRLRHAEAALCSGVSVTEAALAAGFESLPYFSRVYKKYMGVPPSSKKRLSG